MLLISKSNKDKSIKSDNSANEFINKAILVNSFTEYIIENAYIRTS